jgi:L,D-transpeptidase ErfK/SrfK
MLAVMPNTSTTSALALASSLLLFPTHALSESFSLPPAGTDLVGEVQAIVTQRGDTLLDIARRFGLGYGEITAANPGIDPWVPDEGTRVILPTQFVLPPGPRSGIVLNLPQLRLFYFPPPQRGKPAQVLTYPVGIGTDYATTPLGETRVVRREVNPVWRPSRDIREEHAADGHWLAAQVPPGPDNPLGKYALYLGMKGGYLIHGTNKPWGVGMRVSHGCIRLYPESIAALYPQVPVGTTVRIISERLLLGMRGGAPYLQAFPALGKRGESVDNLTPDVETILRQLPRGQAVDWDKAMRSLRGARAVPVPIAPGTPDMEEVIEQASDVSETAKPVDVSR